MLAVVSRAFGQKAIMEGKQAVVCADDSTKCPLGHTTCRVINKPIVIGNDSREYPDQSQLFDFHLLRCDTCHALFTRE